MSCGEAAELMAAFLDGELAVSETARLQHHLGDCEACRATEASEMWLYSLLAAGALADEPPESLRPRILERVAREEAASSPPHPPWWRRAGFPAAVGAAVGAAALLAAFAHLPGEGLGESPFLVDAVAEHRRYANAEAPAPGVALPDVGRLEEWIGAHLALAVKIPPGAARGETPVGIRAVAVAGRPAAQILYAGDDGRRISLFVARKPSRPLPEEGEHIIAGREVYVSALGADHLGWWEDRRHLYLVVSSAGPDDLLALAELCMRSQRSRPARLPAPQRAQSRGAARDPRGRATRRHPEERSRSRERSDNRRDA